MARRFETSHPWLKFDIQRVFRGNFKLWANLGECASKCEHIAGVPLRPDVAANLHKIALAKGALATTAIEGNTLSESEVLQILAGSLKLPPSREYLQHEVDNIAEAFDKIWKEVGSGTLRAFSVATFNELNGMVLGGLKLDDGVVAGQIRTHEVGVSRYRGAPPEDCEFLLRRLAEWIHGPEFDPPAGMEISYAIVRAVMAHLYLAWIHPFGDGNGRTSRLVEYRVLLAAGCPTPAVHLLSNHYNLTRSEYYRQLDRTSATNGDYVPFIEYAVQGLLDGLRQQLKEIRDFQLDVIWRNYVHEMFSERKSDVDRRRRDLVLALSIIAGPVRMAKVADLNAGIAKHYHRKTRMVLNRDLNELLKMGLIVRGKDGASANKTLVEAFLPFRVQNNKGASKES